MAGVLERIRWPQKKQVVVIVALRPLPWVNPRVLELQAAKEILAEVFQIRVSEVDEMILSRCDDVPREEERSEESELWPREFSVSEESF